METKNPSAVSVIAKLNKTNAVDIATLGEVKNAFVSNYNLCNKGSMGELAYHRQLAYFNQAIQNSADLQKADKFSLYACFINAAVNDYSLDPADDEVYLLALKGKAVLWRQAGAHIKRLKKSGQLHYADQVRFVYDGDDFEVQSGRVTKHIEKFKSETIIVAYVRFVIDEKGTDRYFIYRKSDWEAWKSKAPNKTLWESGINKQPDPGFLRTKIVKHAAKEKVWATGQKPMGAEIFTDVEIEELEDVPVQNGQLPTDTFISEPIGVEIEEEKPEELEPTLEVKVACALEDISVYTTSQQVIDYCKKLPEEVRNDDTFRKAVSAYIKDIDKPKAKPVYVEPAPVDDDIPF